MTQSSHTLPDARQIHQLLLDLPLPMPTGISTSVRHPHTVWVAFDHGTGDGGDAAVALDAGRVWIAALDGSLSYDRRFSATWQVSGYATWHGWTVSIIAIVDLSDLDAEPAGETRPVAVKARLGETSDHYALIIGSRDGHHIECACGWKSEQHRESEDADGEFGQHLRTVERVAPPEWPPQAGDLWRDRLGCVWFAADVRDEDETEQPDIRMVGAADLRREPNALNHSCGPLALVHREQSAGGGDDE